MKADYKNWIPKRLLYSLVGGTFAIHDLMSTRRYGDMDEFVEKLKSMGYESIELIDTTNKVFMTPSEARRLGLLDSTLLIGRK